MFELEATTTCRADGRLVIHFGPPNRAYAYVGGAASTVEDASGLRPCSRATLDEVLITMCLRGGTVPGVNSDAFQDRICCQCGWCQCMAFRRLSVDIVVTVRGRSPRIDQQWGTPCTVSGSYTCKEHSSGAGCKCKSPRICIAPAFGSCRDGYESEQHGDIDLQWRKFTLSGRIKYYLQIRVEAQLKCAVDPRLC